MNAMSDVLQVVPVTGRAPAKVYRFASLEAIGETAKATGPHGWYRNAQAWTDNLSFHDAANMATTAAKGDDPKRLAKCEEMFDRLVGQGLFVAKDRLQWRRDFHGHIANVSAYVAGDPQHWNRVTRPRTDKAPLRVVIDVTSSAGLSQETLAMRGVALTALVRALKMTRPTTLEVVTGLGGSNSGYYSCVALDSDDLTACAWALGSAGYARALTYSLLTTAGASGGWPYGLIPTTAETPRITREALALGPDDVFVPPAFLDERGAIMADPIGWLNTQLEKDAKVAGREHIPLEAEI